MGLLKKAENESAFLKTALYGEAGSGKTYTASLIAIGLHKYIKSKKPIAFIDSECGSDFMIPVFKEAKIDLLTAKTRAFKDCLDIIDEAEKDCAVLILDSLTHIWNEMTESYCRQHKISRISISHWPAIKQTWRELTKKFINSSVHIIMAGRSADKWEDTIDEEGVKEIRKVGTKLRGEVEISYEPNLLVELEQVHKSPKIGSGWIHRAWIIKDRWNVKSQLEGKHFDNPTFDDFLPHIELLAIGKKHRGIDADRTSDDLFQSNNNGYERKRQRDIILEKINAEFYIKHPGQSVDDKMGRSNLMNEIFNTRSWKEIEGLPTKQLHQGLDKLEKSNGNDKETKDKKEKTK